MSPPLDHTGSKNSVKSGVNVIFLPLRSILYFLLRDGQTIEHRSPGMYVSIFVCDVIFYISGISFGRVRGSVPPTQKTMSLFIDKKMGHWLQMCHGDMECPLCLQTCHEGPLIICGNIKNEGTKSTCHVVLHGACLPGPWGGRPHGPDPKAFTLTDVLFRWDNERSLFWGQCMMSIKKSGIFVIIFF